MPTDKKRINISIPDDVYLRLQNYRKKYALSTDAGACLQLIIQQLDNIDKSEQMLQMVARFTPDELKTLSDVGLAYLTDTSKENKQN